MIHSLRFIVPGRPVPKMRPRVFVQGGRAVATTPPKTREYERLVGLMAAAQTASRRDWPTDARYRVTAHLYVARTKPGGIRKLDADNALKSVLDGCNGVLWVDDDQCDDVRAIKVHVANGEPEELRVMVEVMQ